MLCLEATTPRERRAAELEAAEVKALSLSLGPGWIRNADVGCLEQLVESIANVFSSRVFNVKANRHRLKIPTHVSPNDHWLAAARFTFLDIAIWHQRTNNFSAFDGIRAFQSVPQKCIES